MKIENRLKEIGIKLPDAPAPAANYVPSVVVGDIVYISGQVSSNSGSPFRRALRPRGGSVV